MSANAITAPTGGADFEQKLVPQGYQLCTLFGIAVTGTHQTMFGEKLQGKLQFEFPLDMHVFKEGDPAKPNSIIHNISNWSLAPNSNLKKLIDGALNKVLTEAECESFDFTSLIGMNFVAEIQHNQGKTNNKIYDNIISLRPLTDQMRTLFHMQPGETKSVINNTYAFGIGQPPTYGFDTPDFAKLPEWLQKVIQKSKEGQDYINSGRTFPVTNNNNSNSNTVKVIVTDTRYSYEDLKAAGHTDETMVRDGFAKWAQPQTVQKPTPPSPAPTPSPAPQPAPTPVSNPSPAPSPNTQSATAPQPVPSPTEIPNAPNLEQPKKEPYFKFNDEHKHLEPHLVAFRDKGWTDEMLVQAGYGQIVDE